MTIPPPSLTQELAQLERTDLSMSRQEERAFHRCFEAGEAHQKSVSPPAQLRKERAEWAKTKAEFIAAAREYLAARTSSSDVVRFRAAERFDAALRAVES